VVAAGTLGTRFEILELRRGDPAGTPPLFGQSAVVMRKLPGVFTIEDLERPEPDEPREFAALKQNIGSLRRELAKTSVVLGNRSWRLTSPLRTAAKAARPWLARCGGARRHGRR
jgi:hypothetical protein